MSTSSSTSTSKGCGRPCSSGSTPWTPSSRRPAITILSIVTSYPTDACVVRSSLGFLRATRADLLRRGGCVRLGALRALGLRPLRLGALRLRQLLLRGRQRRWTRTRRAEQPFVHGDGDDLAGDGPEMRWGER